MPLQIDDALLSLHFSNGVPIALSPDGEWVAYTLDDPHRKVSLNDERYGFLIPSGFSIFRVACDVWSTHTTSGESKCLTEGKGNNWGPVWSPDGNHLAFYSDRNGQAQLWVWEKISDTLRLVSDAIVRPYYGDQVVRWTPDGRKMLCKVLPEGMTLEGALDLIVGPRKPNTETQPSVIEWRSIDGQRLRGVLLLPSDYEAGKQYPLIVWVYGGKWGSDTVNKFGLDGLAGVDNLQILATRGYAVLCPDAPLKLGTPMQDLVKTVLPGVDRAVEMGIADPDRLGVMGQSYGGYCTLASLVQTTRFKAAVSSAVSGNLISEYGFMRRDGSTYGIPWAEEGQGRMGGTPWQFRDRYIENSPIFYLDRVQTPLLIIHGAIDNATPSFLADEIFVGLRRLEKQVVYAKYEGETHAPMDWGYANQVDYWNRILAWFDGHLKK